MRWQVSVDSSEAFALFFKENNGPVFRTLLAGILNRAAAEDATAEAFARALAHWDTVAVHPRNLGSIPTWLPRSVTFPEVNAR
jgi:hypothetical protein